MILKTQLDEYVDQYETRDFIKDDPIQFPHRYEDERDIEIAAFISSMFAFGRREVFIKKLDELFSIMGNKPYQYVMKFEGDKKLSGFGYRFARDVDVIEILNILHCLYAKDKSTLKDLFEYSYNETKTIKGMLQGVADYFYSRATSQVTQGFYYMLPDPKKNSAVKRLNMFLRWMVRGGEVDLGLWDFVDKSELIIPLDTHVARISRELGFLTRKNNDFQSALEITNELKKFDPKDPVKYDFALFGFGVNN